MRLVFGFIGVFLGLQLLGQINQAVPNQKNYKILHYYSYGTPAYDENNKDSCIVNLEKKYGFDYKRKAYCVVTGVQAWRWERHNKRVDKKMAKRHGQGWRDKYEAEKKKCY